MLAEYQEVAQASRRAANTAGDVAAATRAPSQILVTARQAAGASQPAEASEASGHADGHAAAREPDMVRTSSTATGPSRTPGPIEHTLRDLGISHPDLLARGAELDQAGQHLVLDATAGINRRRKRPSAVTLSKTTAIAALVNNALASGDPRSAVMLRPERPQRGQPEPEP